MRLSANQRAFVSAMLQSAEGEEDGFTILAKRPDAAVFFPELLDRGLLSSAKLAEPIAGEQEGSVRLPYWRGLDYIETIAKKAGDENNADLAAEIASLILSLSRGANKRQKQNYHTWRKLADATTHLPLSVFSKELLSEMSGWPTTRFDRSLVAEALGIRLLPRLIESNSAQHRDFALELLDHLTRLKKPNSGDLSAEGETETGVESYWVNQIVEKNLAHFILAEPRKTTELFRRRAVEVFAGRESSTWLYRPAIEEHPQNLDWNTAENFCVVGLREALSGWLSQAFPDAVDCVAKMFSEGQQIELRIAINLIDARFSLLRDRIPGLFSERLLDLGAIHESYTFLKRRAPEFRASEVDKIIAAIESLHLAPARAEEDSNDEIEAEVELRARESRLKRRWFSALKSAGIQKAAERFDALAREFGPEGEHPDFLSYHESFSGPGPSPFTKAQLLDFTLQNRLIDELNKFEEPDEWRGPSLRALCDVLEELILDNGAEFLDRRASFFKAKPPYQYAFLTAFLRLWANDRGRQETLNWKNGWEALIEWTIDVLSAPAFWIEFEKSSSPVTPSKLWLVNQAAEAIEAATRDDSHAADPKILPKIEVLQKLLLDKTPREKVKSAEGALNHVINTSRGKVIEGLLNFALRCARLEDKGEKKGHLSVWTQRLAPLFDAELDLIEQGNDQFVVLFGQYIPQLQYLNEIWVKNNINRVFNQEPTFRLALAGLSYAATTRPLYRLLRDSGILDKALFMRDATAKDRLIERVAIAILWGDEDLESHRVRSLFSDHRIGELKEVANTFWTIRRQELAPRQIEIVQSFWRSAVDFVREDAVTRMVLGHKLLELVSFFEKLDGADQDRFFWLIQNGGPEEHTWFLGEEFDRLAIAQPEFVGKAMLAYVKRARPFYDHDHHLLKATQKIREANHAEIALEIANELRRLPEFQTLYRELRR